MKILLLGFSNICNFIALYSLLNINFWCVTSHISRNDKAHRDGHFDSNKFDDLRQTHLWKNDVRRLKSLNCVKISSTYSRTLTCYMCESLFILHFTKKRRFFQQIMCVCLWFGCGGTWNNKQSVKEPKQGREIFLSSYFDFILFSGALPHKVSSRFTFKFLIHYFIFGVEESLEFLCND